MHASALEEHTEPEVHDGHGVAYLQRTAQERRNLFVSLMEAVKTHSLGQISHALYDVGGGSIGGTCECFAGPRRTGKEKDQVNWRQTAKR
ncbi:hypothetical protein AAD027_09955 [Pseudoxanthomonas putridarboris]|uniref:Uncharacterized protein n=2 Tax=Pseudoxanthomonas putridarboris TaxID=752605 RepID=A0ABU9J0F2_9GAMM